MMDRIFVSTRHQNLPASVVRVMPRMAAVTIPLCLVAALGAQTNTFPASGNVGIGTSSPASALEIVSHAESPLVVYSDPYYYTTFTSTTNGYGAGFSFYLYNSAGTAQAGYLFANPGAPPSFTFMAPPTGDLYFGNNTGTGSLNQYFTIKSGGNIGIGTANPAHLLHVAGTIGAEEVIVSSTGADYVFQPGYRLRPLGEVKAFIKENHHLPDIPSEAEVKEKGLSLGDMQAKLLAKVEELTLHMIEADGRIREADERNKALGRQNRELRERIARLEAGGKNPKESR